MNSTIRLFNSFSRQKEIFNPIVSGRVRMYVCGVTVYDHSHMGHARSAVVFDMIRRYFKFREYTVEFVKNFTDIDDKIIKRSQEEKIPWVELTQKYITEYHLDMKRLNVETPTEEPRATEYIQEMIGLIQRLIEKGFAYLSEGDVYYRVVSFKPYGRLSKRDLSLESAGTRVEISELKENPLDFVLWKSSKPGEPWWDSPWGKGRPGWHIECSAMAMKLLGETIDIHGGGEDLLFPHHENEVAQSEGSTGKKFVNYWIHNGFVTVNQEKMSKSLGNFFTIKEVFDSYLQKQYDPEVIGEFIRYFLLSTHYRQPVQFSDQAIEEAKNALDRFYDLLKRCKEPSDKESSEKVNLDKIISMAREQFIESMNDDFNTPEALATLHTFRNEINKLYKSSIANDDSGYIFRYFNELGTVLGLFSVSPKNWQFGLRPIPVPVVSQDLPISANKGSNDQVLYQSGMQPVFFPFSDQEIERLIKERLDAKNKKDFKTADKIRDDLKNKGISLEDTPNGKTTWKR
ncbi:MAG: cysteine--tRNA ligase [Nitrospirae bacterium]|nr:cysteine--tRNA ligase [Nitrospirota bacterium]